MIEAHQNGESEVWRIDVRAVGPGPPVAIRLRKFLKLALRGYGLRCVGVELKPGRGKHVPLQDEGPSRGER